MTASSTPGESRQRVSDEDLAVLIRHDQLDRRNNTGTSIRADLRDARTALAKAEARIAEVEREKHAVVQSLLDNNEGVTRLLYAANARADAAEARIATVRAEALEEAAKVVWQEAETDAQTALDHGYADQDEATLVRETGRQLSDAIRALIPAATSSCAAKDGEARHG